MWQATEHIKSTVWPESGVSEISSSILCTVQLKPLENVWACGPVSSTIIYLNAVYTESRDARNQENAITIRRILLQFVRVFIYLLNK